ncbi:sialate O-acetylesterase [Mucilaginibacter yixingensis]|uniref:Sialate O-acetylesterase n=1 Tax=Mucilaginibacter yixingensis TaxID=1295612 RepID=A0A2T5JAK3_9SPHI|nr:sialate O-acetylesterase [Mucilaginibacter yixingensis]PTQ97888.1 sialate O-acetylesterase [Mucilaginibacter yixingensis]
MRKCLALILILLSFTAKAQIKLPAFFADGMVLQQKKQVKIWGTAPAGKRIYLSTSWDRKRYHAQADSAGKWLVKVATPSAGGPYQIHISGAGKVSITNILIGEVWLCSGQSNMDIPLKGYPNTPILNANDILMDAPDDGLRLFHVGLRTSAQPQTDVKGNWQAADAASAQTFSAVGYQFARFIHQHLKVPVGIIQATWAGSAIEAWMDKQLVADVLKDSLATDKSLSNAEHRTPGNIYNGMIAPLMGYSMAGVIWYQGEQNRFNYYSYPALQTAMVTAWRKGWESGDWPFYYVQIAPMRYPVLQQTLAPRMREAQLKITQTLANSGVAIAIDAGEEHNIHPANKTIIARRLAYWALGANYQKKGITYKNPRFDTLVVDKDTARVKFADAPNGLTTFGKNITQFEIAGSDKVFYPATAVLRANTVNVHSDSVKHPVAIRYAFKDWATGELYSTDGLPVSSFRTDNW